MHNARHTDTSIKCPVALWFFGKIPIVSSEWLEKSGIRRHCMLTGESECIQFVGYHHISGVLFALVGVVPAGASGHLSKTVGGCWGCWTW